MYWGVYAGTRSIGSKTTKQYNNQHQNHKTHRYVRYVTKQKSKNKKKSKRNSKNQEVTAHSMILEINNNNNKNNNNYNGDVMEYEIYSTNTSDYNKLSNFILPTSKDETEEVERKFKNMRVVSPDE